MPTVFKHTVPRDGDLPLKQTLYDTWGASPMKDQWEALVKEHDKNHNKSGVPHKARRLAEVPIGELPGAEVVTVDHSGQPELTIEVRNICL